MVEVWSRSKSQVAVVPSQDYLEVAGGSTASVLTTARLTSPDGSQMVLYQWTGADHRSRAERFYLDGTTSNTGNWLILHRDPAIESSPADGTWMIDIEITGLYNADGISNSPPITLHVAGKTFSFETNYLVAATHSRRLWNWHESPTIVVSEIALLPPGSEPHDAPGRARYFVDAAETPGEIIPNPDGVFSYYVNHHYTVETV